MFIIEKWNCDNMPAGSIPVFPDDDYLHDYVTNDIGSCVSTLGIEAMLSRGFYRMGDSDTVVWVRETGITGAMGIAMFKRYTEAFVSIAKESMPVMSPEYQDFFRHMINDYEKNGINMPVYGKL